MCYIDKCRKHVVFDINTLLFRLDIKLALNIIKNSNGS